MEMLGVYLKKLLKEMTIDAAFFLYYTKQSILNLESLR